MSQADALKDQLLNRLLLLRQASREASVEGNITGEFNLILVVANDQLGFDMRDLSVKEGERNLHPLAMPMIPYTPDLSRSKKWPKREWTVTPLG